MGNLKAHGLRSPHYQVQNVKSQDCTLKQKCLQNLDACLINLVVLSSRVSSARILEHKILDGENSEGGKWSAGSPGLDIKMREGKGRGEVKGRIWWLLSSLCPGVYEGVFRTFNITYPWLQDLEGFCKKLTSSVDVAALTLEGLLLALGVNLGGRLGVFLENFPWGSLWRGG